MQNTPSQTAPAAERFPAPPLQAETADRPSAAVMDTRERVTQAVELTSETLTERLGLLEHKLDKGSLTVPELEELVADFCTYTTYKPKEDMNGLADRLDDFYKRLKLLVVVAKDDANVGGTNTSETDKDRKTALNGLVGGLELKFRYFKGSLEKETPRKNTEAWYSGM